MLRHRTQNQNIKLREKERGRERDTGSKMWEIRYKRQNKSVQVT